MEIRPGRRIGKRLGGAPSVLLLVLLAAAAVLLVAENLSSAPRVIRATVAAADSARPANPGTALTAPGSRARTMVDPSDPSIPAGDPPASDPPMSGPPTTAAPTTAAPTTVATDPPATDPPTTVGAPLHAAAASAPPSSSSARGVPAAPAATAGYGCAAAITYLQEHAAPGFTFECPGNALGHQAMTCAFVAGVCPNSRIIAIADPCPAAYMNEAYNSRVAEGLASGPFDPYGYCRS